MSKNPFTSNTFAHVWNQHFNQDKETVSFNGISGIGFIRTTVLPLYTNIGKNLTKGLTYTIEKDNFTNLGHKALLIMDIPSIIKTGSAEYPPGLKVLKVEQYPGFLIDLAAFDDFDDYMRINFKKSSRYKLNKYKKRLEASFDISYKVFFGSIQKEAYDALFQQFRVLLEKRFAEKKVYNNNLESHEWDFYHEVTLPLIHEKKAALFVVLEKECPIAITLLYFDDDTVIDAITVFDVDYSKFHLGSCSIMKLIEWSMEKGYKKLDFSKGYFDYKRRWCTQKYQFEYHLLYNPKSPFSTGLAHTRAMFLRFKAYLRKKNVNWYVHKTTYFLRSFKISNHPDRTNPFMLSDSLGGDMNPVWTPIPLKLVKGEVKKGVFDFLYLTVEKLNDVSIFQADTGGVFKIKGKSNEKYLVSNELY
ncbi:GNAT family N-acetyltransferase [Allomuricauda sp. SCSIO 65647]|uniref:GNAT family N-acetyltransferase n=1 Tax=Allomuricauda sp. SCSIO 65647 TaxID=2908843 RepID=UPI001F20A50E|nr:GNAT family N-acetyltransferase [Muricauda sp. SCSIO 65647]UJH67006.1 GNAT family N-acetyltransferase [Muricauda sp. SCSIO 65647]